MDIYVQKNGQQHGPIPETKVREGIDAGKYSPNDLAWTAGKASWQPLSVLIKLDVNLPPPITEPTGDVDSADSIEPPAFQVPSITSREEATRSLITIAIEDDDFTVNGSSILIPTAASPANPFLGVPRWRKRGMYFWDDWSITAWGDHRKTFGLVQIYLREHEYWREEHYPKRPFSGKLLLGGVLITEETRIEHIVANKRGLKMVEKPTDCWSTTESTLFRKIFYGNNPSISLYTTHQDTVSRIMFRPRDWKS